MKGEIAESEEAEIYRQQPGKHAAMAMDMHATIEEWWEVVFSKLFMPRQYNKDHR
jgi:hypothetical protein